MAFLLVTGGCIFIFQVLSGGEGQAPSLRAPPIRRRPSWVHREDAGTTRDQDGPRRDDEEVLLHTVSRDRGEHNKLRIVISTIIIVHYQFQLCPHHGQLVGCTYNRTSLSWTPVGQYRMCLDF